MSMIRAMEKSPFHLPTQVKANRRVKSKVKALVAELDSSAARFREGSPTLENVTNALWLWLASKGPDRAEDFLVDAFAALDAFLKAPAFASQEEDDPAEDISDDATISGTGKPPRPKRKGG